MSERRVVFGLLWCVCGACALFLGGCKTGAEAKPDEAAGAVGGGSQGDGVAQVEPEPEPEPAFCQEGAREYKSQSYRWCVEGGVMSGPFEARDEQGGLVMEGVTRGGLMEGTWRGYHAYSSDLAWEIPFVAGKESGMVRGYDRGKVPRYEIMYEAGERHGDATLYDKDGSLLAKVSYQKGKPVGEWGYWHPNGQKAHEYLIGAKGKDGIHKHWDPSGKKLTAPTGQLSKNAILPVVDGLEEHILACYNHARIFDAESGKLVAQITIGYGGEVSQIDLFAEDFKHPFMGACTRRAIESLSFPRNPYGPQKFIRTWQLAVE